jgi:N-methylhydantoinase B
VQTRSAIQQAFKFLVNPGDPACGGAFRNLEIIVPHGSCFDPHEEAAYLHYGPHLMLAMDLMVKALSTAVPDRAAAGHVGDSWNVTFTNAVGEPVFMSGESLSGGWGGWQGGDGEHALIHSAAGDFKNVPVETMEQRYPIRLLRHAFREASGGDGAYRGGNGIERFYEVLDDARLSLWFERSKTPSWGLEGGGDGLGPDIYVTLPGGSRRRLLKTNAMSVPRGTLLEVFTGGGGGWGDPAGRAAEARREDE